MNKEAYRRKAEAKIEEGQARLNLARAKAKGASADTRLEVEKNIQALEKEINAAKARLAKIGNASAGAWEDLTKGLDDAWDDISGSINKVIARFK